MTWVERQAAKVLPQFASGLWRDVRTIYAEWPLIPATTFSIRVGMATGVGFLERDKSRRCVRLTPAGRRALKEITWH